MDTMRDNEFVVFLRADLPQKELRETVEVQLASCATYEEARRIRRDHRLFDCECIIRYVGETGGGD